MTLMIENTTRVAEATVLAIPEPTWTKTWHPIGHAKVIGALQQAVNSAGLATVDRQYSMNMGGKAPGTKLFGVWELDQHTNGSKWAVGFRQSLDKSMAIGVCAGTKVVVCDNMLLSGEFVEFRKHTGGLSFEELLQMMMDAMGSIIARIMELDQWHQNLKRYVLPESDYKQMVYDGMQAGVLAPKRFNEFQEAHALEMELAQKHGDPDRSLYTYHGAATRLMRTETLFNVSKRNGLLNKQLDAYREVV